jgi:hypothetical protein
VPVLRRVVVDATNPGGFDAHYTSLEACCAAELRAGGGVNFVSLDRRLDVELGPILDTTPVSFGAPTTDATRYPRFYPRAGTEPNGKWSNAAWRLVASTNDILLNTDRCSHFIFEHAQVHNTAAWAGGTVQNCIQGQYPLLANFRIWWIDPIIRRDAAGPNVGGSSGYPYAGFYFEGQANNGIIGWINPVIIGRFRTGLGGAYNNGGVGTRIVIYNPTIVGTEGVCLAYAADGNMAGAHIKNALLQPRAGGISFEAIGPLNWPTDYVNNASSDANAPPNTVGGATLRNRTFVFYDAASFDYRLDPTDTGATGVGADLSADARYPFAVDAAGSARTVPWSVGALNPYAAPGSILDMAATGGGTAGGTGGLVARRSMAGTGGGTATGTATLSAVRSIAGTGGGTADGSAGLVARRMLAATGGGESSGTGLLELVPDEGPQVLDMAATGGGTSGGTGGLVAIRRLVATGGGVSGGAGALAITRAIQPLTPASPASRGARPFYGAGPATGVRTTTRRTNPWLS